MPTPPSHTDDARQFIETIASRRLRAFKATIDAETGEYLDDPYAQNKSLSEHVAADYHGRCLIELIQNGNDAHPPERSDGEIEVLLADEGTFGTVYVANRGLPFSEMPSCGSASRANLRAKQSGTKVWVSEASATCVTLPRFTRSLHRRAKSPSLMAFASRWSTGGHSMATLMTRALVNSLKQIFRCSRYQDG